MSASPIKDSVQRRPRISREYLEEHRRRRYADAVAELLHEFPRHELSVSSIVRLAGTARNSFYEVFRGADDCIAYGARLADAELFPPPADGNGDGDWIAQLQEAVVGFYGAVASRPLLAELLLIHATAGAVKDGPLGSPPGVETFEDLLRRGRSEAEAGRGAPLPESADEYFARTIVAYAVRRVRDPDVAALPAEARDVVVPIAGFYLGSDGAARLPDDPAAWVIAA